MLLLIYQRAWLVSAIKNKHWRRKTKGLRRLVGRWRVGDASYWSGGRRVSLPTSPLSYSTPYGPRTQADISEALAPSPPATSEPDAHYLPATQQRNHTPFSCQDPVTGFSNSIYSAIENLSSDRWDHNGISHTHTHTQRLKELSDWLK